VNSGLRALIKPPALAAGSRVAVVSPSSGIARDEFDRGLAGLRQLGWEPFWEPSALDETGYVAGPAHLRAAAFLRAWRDPSVGAVIASRGGYGSAQILPWLDPETLRATPKIFIGYSDTTAILSWLTTGCGIVAAHGPMLDRRFAAGAEGFDRASLMAAVTADSGVPRELAPPELEVLSTGESAGILVGGTLSILCASLGTPFALTPPDGGVLFLEEVNERPFRLDRMLTQLRLAGVFDRVSAVVFGEMIGCDDLAGLTARDVVREALTGFTGPVLFGFPSGHTAGPTWTLPLGVSVRVVAGASPYLLVEEAAVQ
jgi:muramoyltetrapeptide carboxypeptidase